MFRAYCYTPDKNLTEIPKSEIEKALENDKAIVWIDIISQVEEETPFLTNVLKIHPLAIEDLSHPRMLPKVEEYDNFLFVVLHDIVLTDQDNQERLKTHELYLFLGKNFVVSIRKHRIRAVEAFIDDSHLRSHIIPRGTDVLFHAIIRRMVDNYFPMLDRFEIRLDKSEERVFNSPNPRDLQKIFILRKDIAKLRAIATQQLDVINRISLGEFETISDHGLFLARDIYDHLYRVSEKAASFREAIRAILDVYLSQTNNKISQAMKILTTIATIMLPLGIVVGFYGMNFKSMPGLSHPYGWLFTIIFMISVACGMLALFKIKRWL